MNDNVFFYKLMKCFKNNGIEIIDIDFLKKIHPILLLILKSNGLNNFVNKYNEFSNFLLMFSLVFLDFELGIYTKNEFIFKDDPDLLENIYQKDLMDISNTKIDEITKCLILKINSDINE